MDWPWTIPQQLENPFPQKPPTSGPYAPIGGTLPFWRVYSRVTAEIREFEHKVGKPDVEQFLEYLIAGFYHEYRNWDTVSPEYFRKLKRPRPLRLMALAYFHMGYDLPRIIARCLAASPPLTIARNDARLAFLRLNDTFGPVLKAEFKSYRSSGFLGIIGKTLPLSSASRIAAYWLVQMRAVAWVHGEILESLRNPSERADFEVRLLQSVLDAANKVAKRWWNPVLWFAWWPAPTVALILPLLMFQLPHLHEKEVIELASGIFAAVSSYVSAAYKGFVRLIETLGQEITASMVKMVPPEYRELLDEVRYEAKQIVGRKWKANE